MILTAHPGKSLHGEYHLPGDKSISHRAALFAALALGESRVENLLVAGVTRAMLDALRSLGVDWDLAGSSLRVQGRGMRELQGPENALDCGNSATTLRLLAGALAASGVEAVLDGSDGLRRRPMGRIVKPLRRMGVWIEAGEAETAPLKIAARPPGQALLAIDERLPVASAQVKSCLLLAGLAASGPSLLREPGPSRDHTERMLSSMGVRVESRVALGLGEGEYLTRIEPPGQTPLSPLQMTIPADISAAAFLIVAALITPGSCVRLPGVGLNPTRTGLLDALREMGADIRVEGEREASGEPIGDLTVTASSLKGIEISGSLVVRMIDEFPALAVAAACAEGTTTVREAEELRYKESDRIAALCGELRRLGVAAQETPDGFILPGGGMRGGALVEAHGDHRLAMALTVAGLASARPVQVAGAELSEESFPEFVPALQTLGAAVGLEE
jgi:3-phosphoshikimate 1-carboxyvinyltransferase